jgi:hypothetical protein
MARGGVRGDSGGRLAQPLSHARASAERARRARRPCPTPAQPPARRRRTEEAEQHHAAVAQRRRTVQLRGGARGGAICRAGGRAAPGSPPSAQSSDDSHAAARAAMAMRPCTRCVHAHTRGSDASRGRRRRRPVAAARPQRPTAPRAEPHPTLRRLDARRGRRHIVPCGLGPGNDLVIRSHAERATGLLHYHVARRSGLAGPRRAFDARRPHEVAFVAYMGRRDLKRMSGRAAGAPAFLGFSDRGWRPQAALRRLRAPASAAHEAAAATRMGSRRGAHGRGPRSCAAPPPRPRPGQTQRRRRPVFPARACWIPAAGIPACRLA